MAPTQLKKKNDDDDNRKIFIWLFFGILVLLLLWWLFSGKKKTTGGIGVGAVPSECNPALWTSKALILPEDFVPERTDLSVCDSQKIGQNDGKKAFIRCKNGDVMFLTGDSFVGTQTACTDCQIYYMSGFTVTLGAESPPHVTITLSPSPVPTLVSAACPLNPYPYCDAESGEVQNVYVTLNCNASTELVKKLIAEGKLDNHDDPRIIKCCQTPGICRDAGITAFPTVQCDGGGTASSPVGTKIQGYCP